VYDIGVTIVVYAVGDGGGADVVVVAMSVVGVADICGVVGGILV